MPCSIRHQRYYVRQLGKYSKATDYLKKFISVYTFISPLEVHKEYTHTHIHEYIICFIYIYIFTHILDQWTV